jgi:hypothetical protein
VADAADVGDVVDEFDLVDVDGAPAGGALAAVPPGAG